MLVLNRPSLVATGLAAAYSVAYLIGVQVSFRVLRRRLPDLSGEILVRHCVRLLLAVAPAAAAAWLICWVITARWTSQLALGLALALAGVVAVGLFGVMARLLKITEVTQIVGTLLRPRGTGTGARRRGRPKMIWTIPAIRTPASAPRRGSIEPTRTT